MALSPPVIIDYPSDPVLRQRLLKKFSRRSSTEAFKNNVKIVEKALKIKRNKNVNA